VATDEGAVAEEGTGAGASDRIVVLLSGLGHGTDQGAKGNLVVVFEAGSKVGGGIGVIGKPVGVGAGAGVGICVRGAIVLNAAPIATQAESVLAPGPGEVVGDVVDRNVDEGGQSMRIGLGEEAEVHPVAGASADAAR
jgi:hypothetical protein